MEIIEDHPDIEEITKIATKMGINVKKVNPKQVINPTLIEKATNKDFVGNWDMLPGESIAKYREEYDPENPAHQDQAMDKIYEDNGLKLRKGKRKD